MKNTQPIQLSATIVNVCDQFYEILGTISHIGTAEAGHNRAYLKCGSRWYCHEDSRMPFFKDPKDSECEQNYCILLKKVPSNDGTSHPLQGHSTDSAHKLASQRSKEEDNERSNTMKRALSEESVAVEKIFHDF